MKDTRIGFSLRFRACRFKAPVRSAPGGFTLIETLVAVMILAISLVVIMQLFSGGLKASLLSSQYTAGIFHAKEIMEELLLADELVAGTEEGEFEDGQKWMTEISVVPLEEEGEERMPVQMYHLRVKVSWLLGTRDRHLELTTIRIGEKPKEEADSSR